jgi:hypothetical protein
MGYDTALARGTSSGFLGRGVGEKKAASTLTLLRAK